MKNLFGYLMTLAAVLYPLELMQGHAILLSTAPVSNGIVHQSSVDVELRFNARIDARRSRLVLVQPGGGERTLALTQPSPDALASNVSGLVPGQYILQWQVLAEDGHITRGQLSFRAE